MTIQRIFVPAAALAGMVIAALPAQNAPAAPSSKPTKNSQSEPARPADSDHTIRSEPEESSGDEHWQSILMGDQRIGYVHTQIKPADEQGRITTDTQTEMTFERFGQELTIRVSIATTETSDGELLGYSYAMRGPTGTMKSTGTVNGDELEIQSSIAGKTITRTVPFDSSVKSPAYQERLLREKGLEPGESHSFRAFIPELNKVSKITITAEDWHDVTLPDGSTRHLLKTNIAQSLLPGLPTVAWLDESGEIVMAEMAMLGQTMRMVTVSKKEALAEIVSAELDLAVSSLIPVTPIENPHETTKVVYRIHVPGADAASLFVDGGTQRVEPIDRETVKVTVTARPIPENVPAGQARAEFTSPSQMIQSNDPAVLAHLKQATSPDQSPAQAARALETYVHRIIKEKNFTTAFASAGQVAKSLEGDCSEHAVLLAALLRARGIPARLVAGIVAIPGRGKMGGHMWTEAKLGDEWIPLDATLGRGGIGGGHLKIGVTSLSNDAPLPVTCFAPLLNLGPDTTIEVLRAER